MPKKTYTQINSVTLAAASSTITFSGIPQNYRDLIVVVNGSQAVNQYVAIRFNSDSGNNYNQVRAYNTTSDSQTNASFGRLSVGNPQSFSSYIASIMDYSASDKHKTWLSRSNNVSDYVGMIAGRWASTSPITSLSVLTTTSDTWNVGSTFMLYGIEA
jgi:hypothetical protein